MTNPNPDSAEPVAAPQEIPPPLDRRSLNLPNLITGIRLLLSIVLFVLIDMGGMWLTCTVLFIVAASTDFLDGYFARKWKQVTQLGRIMDPFVDKIIVCGALIFLTEYPESGVCAWLTFTVIAREMFVTVLRSILEQEGVDFSAKLSGKLKMGIQCVAVPVCLASLSEGFESAWGESWGTYLLIRKVTLILTMAITVYSGVEYIVRGFILLGKGKSATSGDTTSPS